MRIDNLRVLIIDGHLAIARGLKALVEEIPGLCVVGLATLGMPVEFGLFAWQLNTYLILPSYMTGTVAVIVTTATLSFAAFVLPLLDAVRRRARPRTAATWTLLAIAAGGLASGLLLVERGTKAGQGNVMWGAAAAQFG